MNAQEKNKELLTRFYQLFNEPAFRSKDYKELDQLLAPGFTDHNPIPGQGPGVEGLKWSFDVFYTAFPDFGITVSEMIAEGDAVAVKFVISGTHLGDFMGYAATRKQFSALCLGWIRFNNDSQPKERWGLADMNTVLYQLGLMG